MKVVLIVAPQLELDRALMPPIGLMSIASVLEKAGIEVHIIDTMLDLLQIEDVVKMVDKLRPDLVGVSSSTQNRFLAIELCNQLKSELGVFVVAGGPHFGITAEDALREIPALDAVVKGEGEQTLFELVMALKEKREISNIPGLYTRDPISESVQVPKPRTFLKDLNQLPRPAYHLVDIKRYRYGMEFGEPNENVMGIMSSRGCPEACSFCSSSKMWNRSFRRLDPTKFVDELQYLVETYGVRHFDIWDSDITTMHRHLFAICDEIKARRLDIRWYARARINSTDEEVLQRMKDSGCVALGFGVESGSERILQKNSKRVSPDKSRRVIQTALDMGFSVKAFFILSLPGEQEEDILKTLDLAREMEGYGKHILVTKAFCLIFPGTRVEALAWETGVLPVDFSWNHPFYSDKTSLYVKHSEATIPLFENPELSIERIFFLKTKYNSTSLPRKMLNLFPVLTKPEELKKRLRLGSYYMKEVLRSTLWKS